MKKLLSALIITVVIFLIASAGCTTNSGDESTPAPTQTTISIDTPSEFSLEVGNIDAFPEPVSLYQVGLNINRNSVNPDIYVEYSGGAGTDRIETIDVILYRADDEQIIIQTFVEPKQRDSLTFTGSSTKFIEDRIKAVAHYTTGETVVISDNLYKYRSA